MPCEMYDRESESRIKNRKPPKPTELFGGLSDAITLKLWVEAFSWLMTAEAVMSVPGRFMEA
ncbi:hypothetical protein N7490_003673 [Penicillium lividum]|nr:hypothetical protein N7490_003673 [Penicillium lividum]